MNLHSCSDHRYSERLCDFLVWHFVERAHQQHRAVHLWQLLQRRKNFAHFRALLHLRLRADLPSGHILVKLCVASGPSQQIDIRVACNGEEIAFHRWLSNAASRHPSAHKRVRGDLLRHHHIAAQIKRKSADIAGIVFVEVLDVRHLDCTHTGYGRTLERLHRRNPAGIDGRKPRRRFRVFELDLERSNSDRYVPRAF